MAAAQVSEHDGRYAGRPAAANGRPGARRPNRGGAKTRRLLEHHRDVGVEFSRHLHISCRADARAGGARHILRCLVDY